MTKKSLFPKLVLATALVVGALATAPAPSQEIPLPPYCDHHGDCIDVYAPVICSNGYIYGNGCYAWLACATDCVPYNNES
ncbi:MAG TPA: hypothetical protein VF173_24815 [Thermoanaerobaculia bacterium]|nr:hypothetical protein [Thermoanaerobaculia bacterium]